MIKRQRVQRGDARGAGEGSEGSEDSKGSKGKVLRIDRPAAGGFLSLTRLRREGCGLPLRGNAYEVSVTGLAFLCHRA